MNNEGIMFLSWDGQCLYGPRWEGSKPDKSETVRDCQRVPLGWDGA